MYNFFKQPKKPKIQINISVDDQENILVDYSYDKNDSSISNKMATLLYAINHGLIMQHCVHYLVKNNDAMFVSSTLEKWTALDSNNTKNNEPIVKPLNAFFKNVK